MFSMDSLVDIVIINYVRMINKKKAINKTKVVLGQRKRHEMGWTQLQ